MQFFLSLPIYLIIDRFLTNMIVTISVLFVLYLLVMFILGAAHRASLPDRSCPPPIVIQDIIQPFQRPLGKLTIRQLKQRAKAANIPNYSRMVKVQLIAALRAA